MPCCGCYFHPPVAESLGGWSAREAACNITCIGRFLGQRSGSPPPSTDDTCSDDSSIMEDMIFFTCTCGHRTAHKALNPSNLHTKREFFPKVTPDQRSTLPVEKVSPYMLSDTSLQESLQAVLQEWHPL